MKTFLTDNSKLQTLFGNKPQSFYKFIPLNSGHLQIEGTLSVTESVQYLEILQWHDNVCDIFENSNGKFFYTTVMTAYNIISPVLL